MPKTTIALDLTKPKKKAAKKKAAK